MIYRSPWPDVAAPEMAYCIRRPVHDRFEPMQFADVPAARYARFTDSPAWLTGRCNA